MSEVNKEISIEIDCVAGICIIAQIQLASRHPDNVGESKRMAEVFARHLQEKISEAMPDIATVLEMGWHLEFDV